MSESVLDVYFENPPTDFGASRMPPSISLPNFVTPLAVTSLNVSDVTISSLAPGGRSSYHSSGAGNQKRFESQH